jgi:formylglycine-generating enzyme required for sulfatase activity
MGELPPENDPKRPDFHLMANIGLADAVAFCDALSKLEKRTPAYATREGKMVRLPQANGYRLPTEAEWEFACRAGTTTLWFFGDDKFPASGVAHETLRRYQTEFVGAEALPNPFGLIDMYGGCSEWCFDRKVPYTAEDAIDPFTPPDDGEGIARGASNYAAGGSDIGQINSVSRYPWDGYGVEKRWCGLGRVVLPVPLPAG